ncbi:MAG: bifunctional riboflavin kinase/FAD synthetase, partial [Eubacterium sp.]
GFFDGVHLGHRKLIRKAIEIAEKENCKSGVMTFSEHPLRFIFPSYTPWLITTNAVKVRMMKDMGIDHIFLNPFSEALMKYSPEEFVRDYLLQKYNVKHIVVGFNYSFGYKGEGNITMLKEYGKRYGFDLTVIPPCIINDQSISSTLIRELISTGKVDEVVPLLGRDYSITGTIVKGKGLGHTFEIPTANLKMKDKVILPNPGVYYTKVVINGQVYDGLTNLGFNPTFEKHPYAIETYIYD